MTPSAFKGYMPGSSMRGSAAKKVPGMRSMMAGHPGLFEDSRLGSADGFSMSSMMGGARNRLLSNPGTIAKARRVALNDIMFECTSDRFSVNEVFGRPDIENYIKTGSTGRRQSRFDKMRTRMENNLEPIPPLKASELAVTMKPVKEPKWRRLSNAPPDVNHDYYDKQQQLLDEQGQNRKNKPE